MEYDPLGVVHRLCRALRESTELVVDSLSSLLHPQYYRSFQIQSDLLVGQRLKSSRSLVPNARQPRFHNCTATADLFVFEFHQYILASPQLFY